MRSDRLRPVIESLGASLRSQQKGNGTWSGTLSSSALSTATATFALAVVDADAHRPLIDRGLEWLAEKQNTDGGWGDTVDSCSNLSTTLLCYSAFSVTDRYQQCVQRCEAYLLDTVGSLDPRALAQAVDAAYGRDKTFSVPILTMCALAGRLGTDGWLLIRALPFELATLPRQVFAWLRLPVVSYALPALIAMGQVRFVKHPPGCPVKRFIRQKSRSKSLQLLKILQPSNGGFLEAAPLTSFVAMSLAGCDLQAHPVVLRAVQFLTRTVRSDGSWPIDTNLATWVTTLAVNGMAAGGRLAEYLQPNDQTRILDWLLVTQHNQRHPYTNTAPGGWAWSDLPGAVPDADDTAGALLALFHLAPNSKRVQLAAKAGIQWLMGVQNRDGGIPTFCRGWTKLPFDRSCPDITAHAIAAWTHWQDYLGSRFHRKISRACGRALDYLARVQNDDGSWVPLWFGNQHTPNQANPTYGTARVLTHLAHIEALHETKQKGQEWLLKNQHPSGAWGGGQAAPCSLEETALALDALASYPGNTQNRTAIDKGMDFLVRQLEYTTSPTPHPIGLYFSKLWYSEALYPQVFALAALEKVRCVL